MLAMLWSVALLGFAAVRIYPVAIVLLFFAGFFELSFNTMAQALVQLNAPPDIRGRVVGLYNMAGLGMRAFSGITVGLFGAAIGIHWSLGLSAAVLLALLCLLYRRATRKTGRLTLVPLHRTLETGLGEMRRCAIAGAFLRSCSSCASPSRSSSRAWPRSRRCCNRLLASGSPISAS